MCSMLKWVCRGIWAFADTYRRSEQPAHLPSTSLYPADPSLLAHALARAARSGQGTRRWQKGRRPHAPEVTQKGSEQNFVMALRASISGSS